ncbi:MAG: ABC transporter permease [Oscillospiraceae bacterium]
MRRFNRIFTVLVLGFLYVPMIVLFVASFNSGMDIAVWKGFTFSQYGELFRDGVLLPLLANALIIAVISSLVATLLGTMAAIGIHGMGRRLRSATMTVTNIPLTNPEIVTGVSLALLFAFFGQMMKVNSVLGFTTLLIAHITFNLPYVILSVLPKLTQMDPDLRDAALDLGCTPLQSFFKVIIHEIMPGVVSGALMSFTMSLDDFVISYFVYGPNFVTLPVEIYNYTKKPLQPKIYALFTLLFLVILLVMVLMNLLQARDDKRQGLRRGVFRRRGKRDVNAA